MQIPKNKSFAKQNVVYYKISATKYGDLVAICQVGNGEEKSK